jgi:hypothetical protein
VDTHRALNKPACIREACPGAKNTEFLCIGLPDNVGVEAKGVSSVLPGTEPAKDAIALYHWPPEAEDCTVYSGDKVGREVSPFKLLDDFPLRAATLTAAIRGELESTAKLSLSQQGEIEDLKVAFSEQKEIVELKLTLSQQNENDKQQKQIDALKVAFSEQKEIVELKLTLSQQKQIVEQQKQIGEQQKQIGGQQKQIDALQVAVSHHGNEMQVTVSH